MKSVWITKTGPPEVLQIKEHPDPLPGTGEVRVRVRASGVNFADILARMGLYPDAPKLPAVVGYEISGEVDAVGNNTVTPVGSRVIGLCRFGGYSDTVILPENRVFELPEGMSFSEGATMGVNYLTAYQMLIAMARIEKGDRVLVHSGAGGVGLAAIDLCHLKGAEVYATASASKHGFLKDRGVKHLIDYRTQDFEKEIERMTNKKGVDVILDPIGGSSWKKGLSCLAPTGRLVVFGFSAAASGKERKWMQTIQQLLAVPWLKVNPISLMNANKGVLGVNLGHMWNENDRLRSWAIQILAWYREGKIKPTVSREFPLKEAASAHHFIQDRNNIGKVVLVP